MKKKVVSLLLAATMVAAMVTGCGNTDTPAASNNAADNTVADNAADNTGDVAADNASDAADAAADAAGGDLADKKVGVCIYQFSDNFMTLFRTELENYLISQGFSASNITICVLFRHPSQKQYCRGLHCLPVRQEHYPLPRQLFPYQRSCRARDRRSL